MADPLTTLPLATLPPKTLTLRKLSNIRPLDISIYRSLEISKIPLSPVEWGIFYFPFLPPFLSFDISICRISVFFPACYFLFFALFLRFSVFFFIFSCIYQNFVVPLQRKTKVLQYSAHTRDMSLNSVEGIQTY